MSFLERVKTKPGYKILAVIAIFGGLLYALHKVNESELNSIKENPHLNVICNIRGEGPVAIDKSKIIGFTDDGGYIFTNGYASSCYVEDDRD